MIIHMDPFFFTIFYYLYLEHYFHRRYHYLYLLLLYTNLLLLVLLLLLLPILLLLIMFVVRHDLGENQFLHYSSGIVHPYLSDLIFDRETVLESVFVVSYLHNIIFYYVLLFKILFIY